MFDQLCSCCSASVIGENLQAMVDHVAYDNSPVSINSNNIRAEHGLNVRPVTLPQNLQAVIEIGRKNVF
jgi:hypothetical protein